MRWSGHEVAAAVAAITSLSYSFSLLCGRIGSPDARPAVVAARKRGIRPARPGNDRAGLAGAPLQPDGQGAARDPITDLVQRGYRFALCLTHNRAAAEDLVQDAWFAVLRARARTPAVQAKGEIPSREYLFATIRNRFIDQYRRSKIVGMEPMGGHEAPCAEDPWAGDAPLSVANGRLEAALAELRPEERAVLFLSAVEGYTGREIGELLDWPRGTVLSHIHRARIKLRRILDGESDEFT